MGMGSLSISRSTLPFTRTQTTIPCACGISRAGALQVHPPPLPSTVRFTSCKSLAPPKRPHAQLSQDSSYPVQELRVPPHWFLPSKALQESEWLRVTLHKWLDNEYCPEPTNVEISKLAALSYYESLIENQADLGEILLKMARDLESLSFQESFHGAFSSANAAAHLIALRIESHWEN